MRETDRKKEERRMAVTEERTRQGKKREEDKRCARVHERYDPCVRT